MREWKEVKLGDVITFQRGHDLPKTVMIDGSYPVAGSNGVIGFHDKFTTKAPGITIGRSGNIGTPHFYKKDFWAHNTALFVKDFKGNNERFVYYFLKTLDFTQFNTGSAVPSLNRNHIHELDVQVPFLPEQQAIAKVLSSLDDKIDLLHRQNTTLEAMAETLFRQWFVVEADSDETVSLSEFAMNVRDNVRVEDLKKHEHYVGLEHIPRKSISLIDWGKPDGLESNKSLFKKNDILFGKLRSYFHKVVFTSINGVCSTDILVIRPKKKEWFSFCLFWFFNKDVVEYSDLGSGGTRMPRTSWEVLSSYQIPKPNNQRIEEFDKIVRNQTEKITANSNQIRTLTALRDSLLPKLMSGEVWIKV